MFLCFHVKRENYRSLKTRFSSSHQQEQPKQSRRHHQHHHQHHHHGCHHHHHHHIRQNPKQQQSKTTSSFTCSGSSYACCLQAKGSGLKEKVKHLKSAANKAGTYILYAKKKSSTFDTVLSIRISTKLDFLFNKGTWNLIKIKHFIDF